MAGKFIAVSVASLKASPQRVWKALTDPREIKEYLFGTNTATDWKPGSAITYSGEYEGKLYEDKGIIVDVRENELLHTTYFSSMSGLEDKAENYANVIYKITPSDEGVILVIVQDNCKDEESRDHSENNWQGVLQSFKRLVEST